MFGVLVVLILLPCGVAVVAAAAHFVLVSFWLPAPSPPAAAAPVRVLSNTATSVSQYISLVIPTIVHLEYVQGVWIKC